jgi:DNA-binding XRE family transcriptional regulator
MTGTDADTPPAPGRMNGGDEIRKIREGQGLSQRRLAKLADVDRASLLRFAKGDSCCNLDTAGKSPRCIHIPWSSTATSVQSIAQIFRQPCVELCQAVPGGPADPLRHARQRHDARQASRREEHRPQGAGHHEVARGNLSAYAKKSAMFMRLAAESHLALPARSVRPLSSKSLTRSVEPISRAFRPMVRCSSSRVM